MGMKKGSTREDRRKSRLLRTAALLKKFEAKHLQTQQKKVLAKSATRKPGLLGGSAASGASLWAQATLSEGEPIFWQLSTERFF
jgi:hypothetical protein